MTNRFTRAHATQLHVAAETRKTMRAGDHEYMASAKDRWRTADNLSFDVPVAQPYQRSTSVGVESDSRSGGAASAAQTRGRKGIRPVGQPERTLGPELRAGVAGPLTLILPFPPTLNHSSMPNGSGGRYLTDDHKAFRAAAAWIIKQKRLAKMSGRLRVLIELYPSNRRRFDIDNRAKAVLDALQHGGLFADDECIDDLRITRQIAGNEAWTSVTVEALA